MIIIFKILPLLLKRCNNEQKFLIIYLIFNFNKNYFFRIKDNSMSSRLIYVDHERYKLKQNRCDDKFSCMDFYFNKISEIKINQHKYFHERSNELSKYLFYDLFKTK